jgi:Septum formation
VNERWVCKRCFADNDDTNPACQRCGLLRGAEASEADAGAWAASAPTQQADPGWRKWLRFWWIPAIVVVLAVGYFTTARRGDDGTLSTAGNVTVDDLRVGDCFNSAEEETEIADVDGVPCTEPHAFEVFAVADYNGSEYPASDAQFEEAFFDVCVPPFKDYVGMPYEDSELWASAITPTESGWNDGDREFICHLHTEEADPLTESQRNANR